MGIPGSANPLLLASAQDTGYQVSRSLRFNSSDSAYLSRTPASAGNRKTWTWAAWVKRSDLSTSDQTLFSGGTTLAHTATTIIFFRNNKLCYSSITQDILQTEAVYRDASAWYHVVVTLDTTQSTASSRLRFYVNGSEVTQFSTDARSTQLSQNADYGINNSTAHGIGRFAYDGSKYFSGYLADIHFIDGQALTPTSFGEFDVNNVWQPKAYTGSYGTNGFQLKFADNSAATAAALGKDTSGNGHNWTPTNLSVTAGAGNDSLVDTPVSSGTDTGAGGEVRGNYCTLNPLRSLASLTNGNLDNTNTSTSFQASTGTIYVSSGKWYWEVTVANANLMIGAATNDHPLDSAYSASTTSWTYFGDNGQKYGNGANGVSYGSSFTSGDIIGVALDMDAGTIAFYKNNVSQGTAFSTGISGKSLTPLLSGYNSAVLKGQCNFGQRQWAYAAPAGFKALCAANLPTPTIANGATAMDVKLYTGNGSTQTISGLGFSPDFVWIKERGSVTSNRLSSIFYNYLTVLSDSTAVGYDRDAQVTSWGSNSFTIGPGTNGFVGGGNTLNQPYVAWTWDSGSTTTSNTQGSITSNTRVNLAAGFSTVDYVGTGANATVGHGLGVSPSFIIIKRLAEALYVPAACNWPVYHSSVSASMSLYLNLTNAAAAAATIWNNTAPTSTVFSIGTSNDISAGANHVAYCFAPVAGYSAFGSYTGNGSADGPFIYLGFRPAVVIVKMSSSTGNWTILDDKREGYNVDNDPLFPNLSNAEGTTDLIDITSNGFKVRTTDATFNSNASTYVYAAWASSPFAYARAR